jgi:hypothetical protein
VQVAASVVVAVIVGAVQVPLAGLKVTTAPVSKFVPATAKDVVVPALPAVGVTDVMVGPAAIKIGYANAATFVVPPSVLVTV